MPKQALYTKEVIVGTCLEIIRTDGTDALSARSICKKLGCSVAPLFWAFENMEELLSEVRKAAQKLFSDYVADCVNYVPAFKEFGLRLIRFSREEPSLFRYLFLDKDSEDGFIDGIVQAGLRQNEPHFGLSPEQSEFIFRHIWPFACGLAVLSNRKPELYTEDTVSRMLSTQFQSLLMLVKSGTEVNDVKPKSI